MIVELVKPNLLSVVDFHFPDHRLTQQEAQIVRVSFAIAVVASFGRLQPLFILLRLRDSNFGFIREKLKDFVGIGVTSEIAGNFQTMIGILRIVKDRRPSNAVQRPIIKLTIPPVKPVVTLTRVLTDVVDDGRLTGAAILTRIQDASIGGDLQESARELGLRRVAAERTLPSPGSRLVLCFGFADIFAGF